MGDHVGGQDAHGVVDIDVSQLSEDHRPALEMSLRADAIAYELEGDLLRVPAVWSRRVRLRVDEVAAWKIEPDESPSPRQLPAPALARALAGVPYPRPWRRVGAALIDAIIVGITAVTLYRAAGAAVATVASMSYVVGLTAWRGQTIGKLAVSIRVIDISTGVTPSPWQSFTRWFVAVGIGIVLDQIPGPDSLEVALAWIGFVVEIVVLVPILTSSQRRGLHDRAARTVVVDAVWSRRSSGDELTGLDAEEVAESR